MNLDVKKNAFVKLGQFLSQFAANEFVKNNDVCHNDEFFSRR